MLFFSSVDVVKTQENIMFNSIIYCNENKIFFCRMKGVKLLCETEKKGRQIERKNSENCLLSSVVV